MLMQKARSAVQLKSNQLSKYKTQVETPSGKVMELGFVHEGEVADVKSALSTLMRHGCISSYGLTRQ